MRITLDTDKLTMEERDRLAPIVARVFGHNSFPSPESAAVWFFHGEAGDQSEIQETPGELIRRGWRLAFAEMERGVDHLVKMRGREGFDKAAERAPEPLARLVAAMESHWAAEARYRLMRDIIIAYRGAIDGVQFALNKGMAQDPENVALLSELTDLLHREIWESGDVAANHNRLRDSLFSESDKELIANGAKYAGAMEHALSQIEMCLDGAFSGGDDGMPLWGPGEQWPKSYLLDNGEIDPRQLARKITRTYSRLVEARHALRKALGTADAAS